MKLRNLSAHQLKRPDGLLNRTDKTAIGKKLNHKINSAFSGLDIYLQSEKNDSKFFRNLNKLANFAGLTSDKNHPLKNSEINSASDTKPAGNDFEAIAKLLQEKDSFLILAHLSIDGDDLGSMTALAEALTRMGKKVQLYSQDNVPEIFSYLPNLSLLKNKLPEQKSDVVIALECGVPSRTGENVDLTKLGDKVVNIDHHLGNTCYGDLNWVNTEAPAVGEMVYDLLEKMGCEINQREATGIYTAISSDTGSFQFGNVSPKTHRIISRLLETKINSSEISRRIFREKDFNFMKLYGRSLVDLEKTEDGKLVWSALSNETLKNSGVKSSDTQNLMEDINRVAGAEVAVLFKEAEPGEVHVSLRSHGFPVNEIAAEFGGGGHKMASGCRIDSPLPEAVSRLNARIKAKLKDYQAAPQK